MKLPGLLPLSLLMFTAVLAVWLGVSGPIYLSVLREWQTLLGAFAVVAAASIAYVAAMSKVRQDREAVEREIFRKRLGLYLKIEFAMRLLLDEARSLDAHLAFGPVGCTIEVSVDEFRLTEPPELDEAWEYLDVFPAELVQELRTIRNGLRESKAHWDRVAAKSPWTWAEDSENIPPGREEMRHLAYEIWTACAIVAGGLDVRIRQMAPTLPEQERMLQIYGEPYP